MGVFQRVRAGASGGLVVAVAAAIVACASAQAGAQTAPPSVEQLQAEGLVRVSDMDRGALLFKTDIGGAYVPAPLLGTRFEIVVSGPIARTTLTQTFTNPADVFVEGRYLFPLPENAAVDSLRMRVDDRLIEGRIEERAAARERYEQARAEGYVASLVEQERPNVFTTSVANIAPGATIVVQIEYQQTLAPAQGTYGLRAPLVVAPRYSPEPRPTLATFGPEGWTPATLVDTVEGRSRFAQAIVDPRALDEGEVVNPVEVSVEIEAGFPLGPVRSLYHEVSVTPVGTTGARVSLTGPAPADRDFFLSWAPERLPTAQAALFRETEAEGAAVPHLLMVAPPAADALGADRRPREVIFVQDVSGSMGGAEGDPMTSIAQAKAGLILALRRLDPADTFNVVVFNNEFAVFHPAPVPATAENVARAIESVAALEADGGTEMLPALEFALRDDSPGDGRLRQVIFLTDGAVSNENEMLALINRALGRSRLFTVGIGSAPNSWFMTAAADAGRGAHVFIGDLSEVEARMAALFATIETPAITDVVMTVDGATATEIAPRPIPDLYVGDPLTVAFDVANAGGAGEIVLRGDQGGRPWEMRVPLSDAEARPGVARLAARRRIDALEARRLSAGLDGSDRERIDADVLALALRAGLVSRLTSLVAVDVTPTRNEGEAQVSTDVPLNLPAGWDAEAFLGVDQEALAAPPPPAPTPTAAQRLSTAANVRSANVSGELATAEEAQLQLNGGGGAALPQTALGWRKWLSIALALGGLGVALILVAIAARRRVRV